MIRMRKRTLFVSTMVVALVFSNCSSNPSSASAATEQKAVSSVLSLDEALAAAAAHIGSQIKEKTEIVIAGIDTPSGDFSDFLIGELTAQLVVGGKVIVLERNAALEAVNTEHQFQMSGMVSDESAVGIGHFLGANVVLTGSFNRFENYSQFRVRVINVSNSQILTVYTAQIRNDDPILASFITL